MGQDAALQITAELPLDVDRNWVIFPPLTGQAQVGLEMFLDDSIQDAIGRIPGAVQGGGTSLCRFDSPVGFPSVQKDTKKTVYISSIEYLSWGKMAFLHGENPRAPLGRFLPRSCRRPFAPQF
jgi:hypothetical protein